MTDKTWVYAMDSGVDPEEPRPHFICRRCGKRGFIPEPIRSDEVMQVGRSFVETHRGCKESA